MVSTLSAQKLFVCVKWQQSLHLVFLRDGGKLTLFTGLQVYN